VGGSGSQPPLSSTSVPYSSNSSSLQRARASGCPSGHGELAECAALAPLAAPPLVTPVVPEAHVCGAGADTENISPGIILSVAKELRKLCTEPLEGIKVTLNEEEVTDVTAEIVGPGARPQHWP
jgi:hypothetical protein